MLVLQHIRHCFGRNTILEDVSLVVEPGSKTGLIGVNGAGKTTLLSIAAGALRPSSGQVCVDGSDLYSVSGRGSVLPRVALMPQSPVFPKGMTAHEIINYLTWMRGFSLRASTPRADAALERVGLIAVRNRKYGALSGGMRRRVALAQAIASDADVLLLDEPSTGLDPQQRRIMVDLLTSLESSVVMSSHVMEDIGQVTSRVAVLHDGAIRFDGGLTEFAEAGIGDDISARAEDAFLKLISPTTRSVP